MPRPTYEKVMRPKSVLKRRKDEQENVCEHEARLVVCGNEQTDCHEDTFATVVHHFNMKLI